MRRRYDFHSAETIFGVALARAGLADAASYDAAQTQALRAAIVSVGDRVAAVVDAIDALAAAGPAAPPAAPPIAAVPATPAPPPPVAAAPPPIVAPSADEPPFTPPV
ncbi:MAG TPA: hypothetical protein VM734_29110 [Kofleriaceae bacterium]|nr:hypothetical protein [Kofleriaceae bacterium]